MIKGGSGASPVFVASLVRVASPVKGYSKTRSRVLVEKAYVTLLLLVIVVVLVVFVVLVMVVSRRASAADGER